MSQYFEAVVGYTAIVVIAGAVAAEVVAAVVVAAVAVAADVVDVAVVCPLVFAVDIAADYHLASLCLSPSPITNIYIKTRTIHYKMNYN